MNRSAWIVLLIVFLSSAPADAHLLPRPFRLDRVNRKLAGKLIDFTANHGKDRRIWSAALCEKRDMYVYVPPCYDPCKLYPLAIYLHGFREDEEDFVKDIVVPLDKAMACGKLPPVIIGVPDGSVHGLGCIASTGTFFLNSNLGAFEDYLIKDVYPFLMTHFPVRPEPDAHVLLGASMGGGAAFAKVLKYRDCFKIAAGIFPPLNLRWVSCRCKYMDDFDPCCWGWRTNFNRGHEVVARYYGVITIRLRTVIYPLYGRHNPDTVAIVSANNPIEMLDSLDIKPGEVELYVGYAGKDEFNIDAQVESFLWRAREKGIEVGVGYEPNGHHDLKTGLKLLPGMIEWLRPRLEPYSPK